MTALLWRRKAAFVLIFLPLCAVAVGAVFRIPERFRSEATLRGAAALPAATGDLRAWAEGWLDSAADRAIDDASLIGIAGRHGLFDSGKTLPPAAQADAVRKNLEWTVKGVRSEGGEIPKAEVTFAVSYAGAPANAVFGVVREVSDLFVKLRPREPGPPPGAVAALQKELDGLESGLREADNRIASFKKEHAGQFLDGAVRALELAEPLTAEVAELDETLKSLRSRKKDLEKQFAGLALTVSAEPAADAVVVERGRFADRAPQTEPESEPTGKLSAERARLNELKSKLAALQRILGQGHPHVVELAKEVDTLEGELEKPAHPVARPPRMVPNPARAEAKAEIAAVNREIAKVDAGRKAAKRKLAGHKARIGKAGKLAEQLAALTAKRDEISRRRQEVSAQLATAQRAEARARIERVSVVEPPQLPEQPVGPSRRSILWAAIALSAAVGLLGAAARERAHPTLRSPLRAAALTGLPVLAVIPRVKTAGRRRARALRSTVWTVVGCCAAGVTLLLVHRYLIPLEALWGELRDGVARGLTRGG